MIFTKSQLYFIASAKGQLISKANCQAEDSSKKRTNEFVFTSMRRVFVRFLEESSARKKTFRDYLTFNHLCISLSFASAKFGHKYDIQIFYTPSN